MGKAPSPESTVKAMVFPRHPHTNIYLHPQRVEDAFIGDIGAITSFELVASRDKKVGGELKYILISATGSSESSHGSAVRFDMSKPLAQALVLRAGLAADNRLATDVRAAPDMSLVLARGPGGVGDHLQVNETALRLEPRPPPTDVEQEILAEHARRAALFRPEDPSGVHYWPAVAQTRQGWVAAFLGGDQLKSTNFANWGDTPVTCAIFGRKLRDFDNWTLLEPFHVWLEPDEPQG